MLIIFGVMSYKTVKLQPSNDCFASPTSDYPYAPVQYLPVNVPDDYTNMTVRFEALCKWGFWANLINFCILVPLQYYYQKKALSALSNDTFEGTSTHATSMPRAFVGV